MSQNCIHALAVTTCVMFWGVQAATAQSDSMPARRPQQLALGDSSLSYPSLTLSEVIAARTRRQPDCRLGHRRRASRSGGQAHGVGRVHSHGHCDVSGYPHRRVRGAGAPVSAAVAERSRAARPSASPRRSTSSPADGAERTRRWPAPTCARRARRSSPRATRSRSSAQQAFYEVIRATDLVRVARAAWRKPNSFCDSPTSMFRAGTVTRSDLLRAQLQSTTMQEQLLAATDTLRHGVVRSGLARGCRRAGGRPCGQRLRSHPPALRSTTAPSSASRPRHRQASLSRMRVAGATAAALRAARTQYVPTDQRECRTQLGGELLRWHWWRARPGWTVTVGTSYPRVQRLPA